MIKVSCDKKSFFVFKRVYYTRIDIFHFKHGMLKSHAIREADTGGM